MSDVVVRNRTERSTHAVHLTSLTFPPLMFAFMGTLSSVSVVASRLVNSKVVQLVSTVVALSFEDEVVHALYSAWPHVLASLIADSTTSLIIFASM